MSTPLERAAAGRDKTYDLYNEATDWDEAVHWSHYNGAFVAICFMLDRDLTPEQLLDEYESLVADDLAVLRANEEDEPCPACGAAAGEPCDPTALEDFCRTEGCDGDPNDGDSYDGYCPSCADKTYGSED